MHLQSARRSGVLIPDRLSSVIATIGDTGHQMTRQDRAAR
jgi:hypothetical protein